MPEVSTEIPRGGIIMWSGAIANIPSGWLLCDGTNGTPDLRTRFVRGAAAGVDPGGTGGSATGGSHVLVASEIPAHDHGSAGAHTHTLVINADTVNLPFSNFTYLSGQLYYGSITGEGATFSNGVHTHASVGSNGGHTHGGNEPPYYDIAYIMKT